MYGSSACVIAALDGAATEAAGTAVATGVDGLLIVGAAALRFTAALDGAFSADAARVLAVFKTSESESGANLGTRNVTMIAPTTMPRTSTERNAAQPPSGLLRFDSLASITGITLLTEVVAG
jgi:hypothetical protein